MNVARIIGRILSGLFIIAAGIQTAQATLRMVVVFRASAVDSDATSRAVGYFAGSFAMLVLFLWLFRKLGKRTEPLNKT